MVGFPNNPMGFPTKNDHFEVEIGETHHLRKHPYQSHGSYWVLMIRISVDPNKFEEESLVSKVAGRHEGPSRRNNTPFPMC